MYGLAVTLERPFYHYYQDTPYVDGETWDENALVWEAPNGMLEPLSLVEDQWDQLTPMDGILGDPPDSLWKGDRRLGDPALWAAAGNLNPFDINGDGRVELPIANDPHDIDPAFEYDLAQAFIHTITHEMAHALGGPSHTNDPRSLMYKYSNNWARQDFLCDYFRSILRVHNVIR
jgi:hypothetical protein